MKKLQFTASKVFGRLNTRNKISNNRILNKAEFVIMSANSFTITPNQIESCRKLLSRFCKRYKGQFKTVIRCTVPITSKSKNARMGKGKGGIERLTLPLLAFTPIFLIRNVSSQSAHIVTTKMNYKLPFRLCVGKT